MQSTSTATSTSSLPAILGLKRALMGFPAEHFLELVKISAQGNPYTRTSKIVSSIYQEKGVLGFTNTGLTNLPRRVLRETARWPVIDYTHRKLIHTYPHLFTQDGVSSKIATAAGVVFFDTAVLLPLEQLMSYRIKEKQPYRTFYKDRFAKDGIFSLYKSYKVNILRQGIVWGSFMPLNHLVKKKFDAIDQAHAHPYLRQGTTSITIATLATIVGLPVDFVKVRIQMDPNLQKMGIIQAIQTLFKECGARGFYAGREPVFLHAVLQATLKGIVADSIEI